MLAAVDSYPHGLLAALVHPVQAVPPPILLLGSLARPGEDSLPERPDGAAKA